MLLFDFNLNLVWYVDGWTIITGVHILITPHSWQSIDEEEEAYYKDKDNAYNDSGESTSTFCWGGCLGWWRVDDSCHKSNF